MAPEAKTDATPRSDSESDTESERAAPAKREQIPDAVDHFLGRLLDCIQVRNVNESHKLYEETFNKLTEKHYAKTKWPSAEAVADNLGIDNPKGSLFVVLYKELYYRHIYTKLQVTYDDRQGSFENYAKLLELLTDDLKAGETLSVALPTQWLWDILDEFVYHYQTFCTFRNKTLKMAKEPDVTKLKDNPDVFDTTKVLKILHEIVKASLIEEYLKDPSNPEGKAGSFTDELVRKTGYFAMMQLMRLHSLLGDYRLALKTIEVLDFTAEVPLFYNIPACHITLYYYMGFAYLMMRRYVDAIKTFSSILVFLSKASGVNSLSYQFDTMMKKQDQMYALLLICLALCPQPIDDSLDKHIKEKHAEKQARLQRGEELCFEELFSYACPKFVSAASPSSEGMENFNPGEAHQRQLHLFLQDVKQQRALPKIGSYMKLYTSLKAPKLAQLCEMDEEGLRDQLMCVMHKTRQRVRESGAPISGEMQQCSEVEFYLDGEIIHINSHKPTRPHADIFLEHILKFQDVLRKMESK
jgi:translation initiation factor 3 subunit L